MATLDDLDREVRKLRTRISELEGAPTTTEEDEIAALIGDGVGSERRAFSQAIRDMDVESSRQRLAFARGYVKEHPEIWKDVAPAGRLGVALPDLTVEECRAVIAEFRGW